MKTYVAKPNSVTRQWYVVDASGLALGRLASQVAAILRGKHKPQFTPHVDTGDFVIVVNAEKIRLTGRKLRHKIYYRHTGYKGSLHARRYEVMVAQYPERTVELAVRRMLPPGTLGRAQLRKLKVYRGPDHPHAAQNPQALVLPEERRG